MNKYVITYSEYGQNTLTNEHETIEGKNPIDALKKRFNKDFKKVFGEQGRYSNIILVKGWFDQKNNNLHYEGRYQRLCYIELK
jgi:hypothetical protein